MRSGRWALAAGSLLVLAGCVADAPFSQETAQTADPAEFEEVKPAPQQDASATAETWLAKFETSQGNFTVEVHPEWSPQGAARFRELVESGFFTDCRFFRVVEGFMVQFGINGDPEVAAKWRNANILDDPVKQSNTRGMMTFATSGPNSRTTQLFINFGNNKGLDSQGFSPFARVIEGMAVVDKLYSGYGEGAPGCNGPEQGRIQAEGNAYLIKEFPKLDYIKSVTIVTPEGAAEDSPASPPVSEAAATEEKPTPEASQPAAKTEDAPAAEAEAAKPAATPESAPAGEEAASSKAPETESE